MMQDEDWQIAKTEIQVPESIQNLIRPEEIIRIGISNTDMISKKTANEIINYIQASFLKNFRSVSTLFSHKDCDGEVYWTSERDEKHSEHELTMYDVKKLSLPQVEQDEILKFLQTIGPGSPYARTLADRIRAAGVKSEKC